VIPALEIRDLTVGYAPGPPVLEDVSLTVPGDGFMALIGPNGGGKTTLVKVILGLLRPWSGSVIVLGLPPSKAAPRVGYVPQMVPGRSFPVTALDVALMGRLGSTGPFRRYTADDRAKAMESLSFLGIGERGRSARTRGCCCSTSRSRASTRRPRRASSTSCPS